MTATVLLIDLSGIAHPLWHTSQGSTNPNECSIQTVAKVRALASGQPHVAICCDSGRSFRRDVDPTYKAQRPEADATLQHQIALAVETLKGDGFPVWAVKGFEADDLLASATNRLIIYGNGGQDTHVLIASSDKDMLQLVNDRVSIHRVADTKKATTVTPEVVREEYGIEPSQFTEWLMLVGDTSDNIQGAKGIGEKKATAMLAKYGNLADLYAALDKGEPFQPSTVAALTEFRPRMETVRQLVTLRADVPLPCADVFTARVPADVAVFGDEAGMETAHDEGPKAADERRAEKDPEPAQSAQPETQRQAVAPQAPRRSILADALPDRGSQSSQAPVVEQDTLPPPSTDPRWQLEPRSMAQAITLANHMFASRLFSAYGTPQAVLSTIMAGRELGMQTQASLRAFHIIDGKPSESADLIRAQCLQSSQCEYFRIVERSATKATWVTKRKGDPEVSLTYTIEEGRAAWPKDQKAWDASGWGKRPTNMVTKTAATTLARLVYPDVVLGMYCPEELTEQEVL